MTRHGKPVAQMGGVPPENGADEDNPYPDHWINHLAGACADDPEFCDLLDEIVADRRNQMPRPLPPIFEDDEHDPA